MKKKVSVTLEVEVDTEDLKEFDGLAAYLDECDFSVKDINGNVLEAEVLDYNYSN